jgi:hypothetical protein
VVETNTSVENCTFYHNTAPTGGNLFVRLADSFAHADVTSSILSFGVGTSVTCIGGATASLSCSDVFGNSGGDWVGCIAGQENVNANFSADPFFCDAPNGVLEIRSDSPCAPPGVTGCGLVGSMPVGCGPISLVQESWGAIKQRYRR